MDQATGRSVLAAWRATLRDLPRTQHADGLDLPCALALGGRHRVQRNA